MMALSCLPRPVPVIPELRQLIVERLHGVRALPEQVIDEALLAVLEGFLVGKEFLDGVGLFRHGDILR